MYRRTFPQGADRQAAGAVLEINKSPEVFPFPQGASEYSLGSHMRSGEKGCDAPIQGTGLCKATSGVTAYSLGLWMFLMRMPCRPKSRLQVLTRHSQGHCCAEIYKNF